LAVGPGTLSGPGPTADPPPARVSLAHAVRTVARCDAAGPSGRVSERSPPSLLSGVMGFR